MLTTEPIRSVGDAVQRALQGEVEKIVAEEAVEASKRVEKRVRARTAEIAATVLQRMSLNYEGNQLVIKVDFKNTNSGEPH